MVVSSHKCPQVRKEWGLRSGTGWSDSGGEGLTAPPSICPLLFPHWLVFKLHASHSNRPKSTWVFSSSTHQPEIFFVNLISNGLGKSFFPPKGGHTSILLLTSWWVFFLETVLVFSSGWPQTFSAPPASAFWMLGLQVYTLLLASMNLL